MIAGDGYIKVNYIGYEEALEAQKIKNEQRNAEIKAKNEAFPQKVKNQIEATNTLATQQSTITTTSKKTISNTENNVLELYYGISLLVIFIFVIYAKCKLTKTKLKKYNYNQNNVIKNNAFVRKKCLTPTEEIFYAHLTKLVKEEYKIDPQIVISSIIEAKHYSNWNKINKKTIDFVIRNKQLDVIVAIELDDKTHEWKKDRIERDIFVNDVFVDADIPLIRIKTNTSYEQEIKNKLPKFLLKE